MSKTEFLLDSNVVIGWMDGRPDALAMAQQLELTFGASAISPITRIEVLSFPALGPHHEAQARSFLDRFVVLALTSVVEEEAIRLRRTRQMKLPDAIIAATAKAHGLRLVTLDETLASAFASLG